MLASFVLICRAKARAGSSIRRRWR